MSHDAHPATPEPAGDLEARHEHLLAECRRLRQQVALNEQIVRDLPAGLAILDRRLNYRMVNANYARYFDRSVESIVGLNVFDLVPCSEAYLIDLLHAALERGEVIHKQEYHVRYIDARGTHDSYWDFSYAPLLDDQGASDGIIVLAQEVSARVRMKQELEARGRTLEGQRAFLEAVLDNMEEGIVACDASGVLTMFNSTEQTFHAHPFEPVPYPRWPALYGLHHLDGALMRPEETPLYRAWQGEHLQGVELLLVNPGEDPRLITVRGGPLYDAAGAKLGAVLVQSDITDRRRAELRLKESEARYRAIFDRAPIGILQTDMAGRILRCNPAFERMTGLSEPQLIDMPPNALCHPDERDDLSAFFRDVAAGRPGPRHLEIRCLRADGNYITVRLDASLMCDAEGAPCSVLCMAQDVTEQRQLEQMKDEFVSVVSHELRTPLTSIRAPLLLLANRVVSSESPRGREVLDIAARNVERMVRLVNDILDIQRLTTGRLRMKPAPCDAAGVLDEAVETMRPLAEEAGVRLRVCGESLPLRADATRIVQVLTNLIDNALSFSPAAGTVTLGVERREDEAVFRVSDEGPGVPAHQREMIFERFKQADATPTREKEGTGLGLAICRAIVEQHGGRIWVDEGATPGATFRFSLPLAAPEFGA
jgi:PAS domain S-box-containing protein